MVSVIPYTPEHFDQMELRQCHKDEKIQRPEGVRAVTFIFQDKPIAIAGALEFIPGVLVAWSLLSDKIKECPIGFHRAMLYLIDFYLEAGYRRIQITVRQDYEMGWRWAKTLGFKCEGIMRKYGPDGSDYLMFARVS